MTNIRFALATALLTFGGATIAFAQQPAQRAHGQHATGANGPRALHAQLLKGITLSSGEKANVKNVESKYAAQMKALREQSKPQLETARAARQRGDTAALKALRQNSMAQRQQTRKLLEAERGDLRAALSPENQAKFDANASAVRGRMGQRVSRGGKPGGRTALGQVPRA